MNSHKNLIFRRTIHKNIYKIIKVVMFNIYIYTHIYIYIYIHIYIYINIYIYTTKLLKE